MNNIIWANTAYTYGTEQIGGTTTGPTYCCIEGWTGGGTNIASDPAFVSTEFRDAIDDNFNDGVRDPAWYLWGTDTWAEQNGCLEETNPTTGGALWRWQYADDLELWFRYYRDNNYLGQIFVRWNQSCHGDCVALFLRSTYAELLKRVYPDDFVRLDSNNNAPTEAGTWYDIYVKCEGNDVEVWRAELGEEMTKILETSSATVTTSDTLVFKQGAGTCRIDDLLLPNNWNDFLHLKRDLTANPPVVSPCIETGEPPEPAEDTPPFRDFDDHVAPLDGDTDPENRIRQDIGADEWSTLTPDAFSFWWENFRIVL